MIWYAKAIVYKSVPLMSEKRVQFLGSRGNKMSPESSFLWVMLWHVKRWKSLFKRLALSFIKGMIHPVRLNTELRGVWWSFFCTIQCQSFCHCNGIDSTTHMCPWHIFREMALHPNPFRFNSTPLRGVTSKRGPLVCPLSGAHLRSSKQNKMF